MSTQALMWSGLFVASTVSSVIVNKYVLSILGFTYPTIYQSWQMVCIFVVLLTALVFEIIKQPTITSTLARVMIPQSLIFTVGIYSGSVALSQLPVPLVCAVFSSTLSLVSLYTLKEKSQRQKALTIVHVIETCVALNMYYNVLYKNAYMWLMLHWMAMVMAKLYMEYARIKESDISRAFFNTFISISVLMLISLASGELYRTLKFPHLYVEKFHGGCILSGISGSIVMISNFKLLDSRSKQEITLMTSYSLVVVSVLSLFLFDSTLNAAALFSCFVTMATGVLYCHVTHGKLKKDKHLERNDDEDAPKSTNML